MKIQGKELLNIFMRMQIRKAIMENNMQIPQ